MRNTRWSTNVVAIAFLVAACSSSPAPNAEPTFSDPEEPDGPPSALRLSGTVTVISHVVQPGADSNWTDDRSLRLEVRLKPNGEGGSRWVDDGSTYSNTKSWVEHSEQGEHVVCITDNYWNAAGSGALGSGLTIHADVVGNEMLLKASVTSHATGRNLTVCDGVTAEFPLTGDTSQDMTDPVGCDNSAELSATGTLATGFDFACRIAAVVGQGQTVVTGVVGPP